MQEPRLLENARDLRNASTPFEIILWNHLKGAQLDGHKFRRQYVIDHAIVDFFCPAKGLIVEVDGDTHDADKDAIRDKRHATMGFSTIRFTNAEVGKNLDGVLEALLARLDVLPNRWSKEEVPHPAASRHPSNGPFVLSGGQDCPIDPEGEGM
ncbi:MAG: DUF559 domain-containing protein [Pseudomonadota bacterium]